jgi:hypothetical protein
MPGLAADGLTGRLPCQPPPFLPLITFALAAISLRPSPAARGTSFPYPSTLHDFLTDPVKTAAYLESVAAAH